ncbi:hypothetical protein Trydic_g3813 [Trypoxylus dichotomus]
MFKFDSTPSVTITATPPPLPPLPLPTSKAIKSITLSRRVPGDAPTYSGVILPVFGAVKGNVTYPKDKQTAKELEYYVRVTY